MLLLSLISKLVYRGKSQSNENSWQAPLKDQLWSSELDQRIRSGALNNEELREYTPAPLRVLVPPLDGSRERLLKRIASSLDWYLGLPRQHIRESWSTTAGFAGFPVLFLIFAFTGTGIGGSRALDFLTPILFGSMFFDFAYMTYTAKRDLFITYLKEKWAGAEAEAVAEPEAVQRLAQLNLVLNQVDQDLQNHVSGFLTLPVVLPVVSITTVGLFRGMWDYALVLVPIALLSLLLNDKLYARYRLQLLAQLEASALSTRIASGELRAEELLAHVPRAVRWLAAYPDPPKAYADELRRVIWRVALNVDWYLQRPRVFVRVTWVAFGVAIAAAIGLYAVYFAYVSAGSQLPSAYRYGIAVLAILLGAVLSYEGGRQKARVRALMDYLRGCLA
jgi:hypothetical protein